VEASGLDRSPVRELQPETCTAILGSAQARNLLDAPDLAADSSDGGDDVTAEIRLVSFVAHLHDREVESLPIGRPGSLYRGGVNR
jgi:hypothetical protein